MRYKSGKPLLMIYTPFGVMRYQACGLDKKITKLSLRNFLVRVTGVAHNGAVTPVARHTVAKTLPRSVSLASRAPFQALRNEIIIK